MHYNVPQFIDIEDKIVGPFTAKQLLWIFALGATLFIMWVMIDSKFNFIIGAIPISVLFLALAFYRPYGQPFSRFITSMFLFLVKPKIYMWKRGSEIRRNNIKSRKQNNELYHTKRVIRQKEVYDLSKILDSEPDILNEINKKD